MLHRLQAMDAGESTYYIVGHAKTSSDNPITKHYSIFFMALVVDAKKGTILDLDASVLLPLSNTFIKSLFVGRTIGEEDAELIEEVQRRYHGTSKKALIVAYKDAVKKFRDITGVT